MEGTVLEDLHWKVNDIKQSLADLLRKELNHRQETLKEIDSRIENLLEGGRRFEKMSYKAKRRNKYKSKCLGVFNWLKHFFKMPEKCRKRRVEKRLEKRCAMQQQKKATKFEKQQTKYSPGLGYRFGVESNTGNQPLQWLLFSVLHCTGNNTLE